MNKSETFMSGLYEFCTYIFCTIIAPSSLITLSECLCSSDVYIQFTCLHPVLSALIALSECLCSLVHAMYVQDQFQHCPACPRST